MSPRSRSGQLIFQSDIAQVQASFARNAPQISKPEPIAEYVPPPPFDLASIPNMQLVALINCTESHVRRTLTQKMLADSQAKPSWRDYAANVERGYAVRRTRDGYHNLTPEGRAIAAMAIPMLCIEHDVHLLTKSSEDRWQSFYKCPCGFMGAVRRSPTAPGNINMAHFKYVEFEQRKLREMKAEAV